MNPEIYSLPPKTSAAKKRSRRSHAPPPLRLLFARHLPTAHACAWIHGHAPRTAVNRTVLVFYLDVKWCSTLNAEPQILVQAQLALGLTACYYGAQRIRKVPIRHVHLFLLVVVLVFFLLRFCCLLLLSHVFLLSPIFFLLRI